MTHYRIDAHPLGPMATDLVSGTLWGHLAWAVRYLEGETAMATWLAEQQEMPWLVSSQMPAGMLPRPLLEPCHQPPSGASMEQLQAFKTVKKTVFISESLFLELRHKINEQDLVNALVADSANNGAGIETSSGEADFCVISKAQNRIDRITGRTPSDRGLFFRDTAFCAPGIRMQVFIYTAEPSKERLQTLLDFIGTNGFGAKASTGSGAMRFSVQEEHILFEGYGTRAMSLSHGTLSANMGTPQYKLHPHFGKLGGHFATGGVSPFKYPILMMKPGATFQPKGDGPFGQLLDGVHHDSNLRAIRHHALHLPIMFTEVPPCE